MNIDYLHTILRTSTDIVRTMVGGVEDRYKRNFFLDDGREVYCLFGTIIIAEIDRIIQRPSSINQRMLGQFSASIYAAVRDCPEVGEIVSLYVEHVDRQLGTLKRRRISEYGITKDELTGASLHRSHFSHIRGKRAFPELALEIWNGLIVNDTTHEIISRRGVQNEEQLLDMCRQNEWDCGWHRLYIQYL